MSDAPENPRPRIMWWTRKFGEPLRETFQVDDEVSEQFIDLLAEADRRHGNTNTSGGQSEGA